MNNFHEILINQLAKESSFVTDDGELKKFIIIDAAFNMNRTLIGLLLTKPELKQKFFTEIAGHWVFDINLFVQYMENKNFLKDSYTRFRNKIGLNIDGKFLNQRNEVSLVWPFKDCILEGGQSREDQKRPEIFFNEILAQQEIDQLTEPKVLTNWKRFTVEGEKPVTELKREKGTIKENLIIKGNNLLALYSLLPQFEEKVKLIYIDPPYNTGSDGFGYNDSFNRSTWLTFMKNRLEVAKRLLKKDGIISVQCSFHQFAFLKLIMYEIFPKHLCDFNIQVRHPDRALTGDKEFNDVIEYILIFSKNPVQKMPFIEELKTVDEYIYEVIIKDGVTPDKIQFDNKLVEIYNPEQYIVKIVTPNKSALKKISIRGSIREKNSSGRFYVKHLENLKNYPPETLFKVPGMGDGVENFRFFYNAPIGNKNGGYYQGMPISTDVTKKQYSNFYNFEKEYNNVSKEGDVLFRNGKKPEKLIKFLLSLFTTQNDIVLDYHLGSGTTATTAHKMNRQYIGIEQMDYIETVTIERLNKVIGSLEKPEGELLEKSVFDEGGISKAVNWQGGGEFVYCELKKYNQTFMEQIEEAQTSEQLLAIWEEMKAHSFLNYNVDIKKQDEAIDDFKQLSIETQKHHLCEILNKNQLYVNLSSIDDEDYQVSEKDKRLTRQFYIMKEEQETIQTKADL